MKTFFGRPLMQVGVLRDGDHFRLAYEGTTELRPHLGHVLIFQSQFDKDRCLVFDSRGILDYVSPELLCVRATLNEILESQGIEIEELSDIPRGTHVAVLGLDTDSPVKGTYKVIVAGRITDRSLSGRTWLDDVGDPPEMYVFEKDVFAYRIGEAKPEEPPELRPTISERSIRLE